MEGLKKLAKKWAIKYFYKYGDCDKAIKGAKNFIEGYYRAMTGKEIPEDFLDKLENQLKRELECL